MEASTVGPPGESTSSNSGHTLLQKTRLVDAVCSYIQENAAERLTLDTIGKQFGVSSYHLQRVFKEVMGGMSPRKYTEGCRIGRLKTRLSEGETVVEALRKSGYSSQSWLYEDSTGKLGMTPATYRRGARGITVMYTVGDSPLGRLLVASTEHGICAVSLGTDDKELVAWLRKEFPNASIVHSSEEVKELFDGVMGYFNRQQQRLNNLPLDIEGTAFQRKVWSALTTIPYGKTCSYSDIASKIGEARAVRAVANACASNPVPLITPCHRVIRKDGSLGGYRLGRRRKRDLLELERKLSSVPEPYRSG